MANTFKFGNKNWAVKEDYVLAYNDENDNFKPLPFDFTRATTATYVDSDGLIKTAQKGYARIDYLDNTDGHLLLEPQRTNLETKSKLFSTWSLVSNVTRTANYNESPEGVDNATRLQFTANGYLGNTTQSGSTQYTLTCYAKRNDSGTQSVGFFTNGSGAVNSAWSLTSEWQRFTYTYTSTNTSFIGIAGLSGADVSVYGFQIEAGSYATSYIPTEGSSVTRNADVCNGAGNSEVFNDSEGVLYAEISALSNTADASKFISISDETYNNRASIMFSNGSTNQIRTFLRVGGVAQIDVYDSVTDVTDFNKVAFSYKENDFKVYINGSLVSSDTSGSVWASGTITKLSFSEINTSLGLFNGKVKDLKLYNTALSDSELETLTT